MEVGVGPHAEMDVRQLLVKQPKYVKTVLAKSTGTHAALAKGLRHYIAILDAKPFVEKCAGDRETCTRPVTRGTAYYSHSGFNPDLMWWCDKCDPHQLTLQTLPIVSTYADALKAVATYGGAMDYPVIMKCLVKAKGWPARATAKALDEFFSS